MALAPGVRLGPYEITARIGAGGMGEVYRARDSSLGRDVAIKVLLEPFARDPERLARFEREARTLASLNHPNIAHVHGLERSGGTTALVMEFVGGPTLADRVAQGPIAVQEALLIAKQIAEGLEAAHEQGIVHRDLKPANIKVRSDDTVKILDFGLAKALEPASATSPSVTTSATITSPTLMTGIGVLLGTAAYMSPEQARGKQADKRADVWAFGCVLFEMLTGTRAFEDEDVSMTLSKVLQREPNFDLLPSDVPACVRQTIQLCLRKPLKDRLPDMATVRLALDGAFETPAPSGAQLVVVARPLRRPATVASAAVVAVLLTGLGAWGVWPDAEPRTVNRFAYDLPAGQSFRNPGRPVIAFSRDGRHFVYNTAGGLYLRAMDALDARLIPGTEGSLTTSPFFAPDGESIGYLQAGQLKRISVSGGAAVVICAATNPFGVSWERDDTIFFGQGDGIMRVSANGGEPQLVIRAKEGEQVHGPQLLPDGDSVLFSATSAVGENRWDEAEVVVQSLSTGKRTVVLKGGSDARYLPTGHLVYALGDVLFAVAFDIRRPGVRGGPVPVIDGVARAAIPLNNTAAANYGVSDNGTLVYVAVGTRGGFGSFSGPPVPLSTLVWVDREGREEPLPAPPRPYLFPRLSPDGSRVAFDIWDQEVDIWTWDLGRDILTRLTFDPEVEAKPTWTPDGRRLIWASARTGRFNLYWQAADGTGMAEQVTEGPNGQFPGNFTPDGRTLVFEENVRPFPDLMVLSLDGERRVTPLLETNFIERNPELSPDGRWLAYESNESGPFQIYVRPFPAVNNGRWQVTTDGGGQPYWARTGRELFYMAPDGRLMGARVDVARGGAAFATGMPTALMGAAGYLGEAENLPARTYDASPDASRFLRLKLKEGESSDKGAPRSVIVVQNWTEELTRLVPTN